MTSLSDLCDQFTTYDEAIGTAARTFAAFKAGLQTDTNQGKVIWIPATRDRGQLFAEGLQAFLNLDDLTLIRDLKHIDALWAAEQALRSGAASLVILELLEVYTLTQSRRLKLALEAGGANLTTILPNAAQFSSTSAYTRWACEPVKPQHVDPKVGAPESNSFLQHWNLLKNKNGTLKSWTLEQNENEPQPSETDQPQKTAPLSVVPISGDRSQDQT